MRTRARISNGLRLGPLTLALALLGCAGCAGGLAPAFDNRFADNQAASTARVVQRLEQQAAAAARGAEHSGPLLCATTHGAKPELLAFDLAQSRVRWRIAVRAESRPEQLGDVVLTSADSRLLAFEAASGRLRFSSALHGCEWLGAARDRERIFYVCRLPARAVGAQPRARVAAIDAGSGRTLWQRDAQGELGRPAASAGLVFVPWEQQNLAVLDAGDGRELARLRSADDVIEWVRARDGQVFFGKDALYRLGPLGYSGRREGASLAQPPAGGLPGRPSIMESAFAAWPGTRSARGRIAIYLEPEATERGGVRVARDRYYFVFYRDVFAFDAHGGLRWARLLPHDAIAGQAIGTGLLLASDDGRISLFDADDGRALAQAAVGVALASASFRAERFAPPAAATAVQAAPLRRGLTEIALDTDSRLVPARAFAAAELAKLADAEVTRDLLDIYRASSTPYELKRAVADALRARRTGLEYLIDALAERYDFLEQTRPAPLAVIVPALLDAHETRAVPRLVDRMLDPETPRGVLPLLVHAVAELGDDTVLAPLLAFLKLYRADSSFAGQPDALIEAARGVLAHGGDQAPELLAPVVADGRAGAALVAGLAKLAPGIAAQAPAEASEPARAAAETAVLPEHLTQAAVDATFAEHIDDVRACAIDELGRNPTLARLHIAFIAESDGSTHALSFAPNTPALVDCLYPKVASYRFPRFRSGRDIARYVFTLRAPEAQAAPAASDTERHFWDWAAAHPQNAKLAPAEDPWWRSRQPLALPAAPAARVESVPNHARAASEPKSTSSPAAPAQPSAPPHAAAAPQPGAAATPTTAPAPPPESAPEDAWWVPAVPAKDGGAAPPPR